MAAKNKGKKRGTFTVNTMRMEQSTLWKLDDNSESEIVPMRNREPKVTCLTLCKCFPAQALQVYELAISCEPDITISGQASISGFFAIRDYYDKRRVYIFNETTDAPSTIEFTKVFGKKSKGKGKGKGKEKEREMEKELLTVGKLRIVTPHRGILYGDLVFDYDLVIKYDTDKGVKELEIKGKALYKGMVCPYSSRATMICAYIKGTKNRMGLKFVRIPRGIEAMIKFHPPLGLNFRLTACIGDIPVEIVLHDSEYSKQSDRQKPLKFVLVMPHLDVLRLTFSPQNSDERQEISGFSIYHGLHQQDIYLGSSKIDTTITWSRM